MQFEARKYLYDMKLATDRLATFVAGKVFADYEEHAMLRAAV